MRYHGSRISSVLMQTATRPFEDVKAKVREKEIRYFNLVLNPNSTWGRAEAVRGLISTLDVYESFHLIRKQPTWAAEDGRVKLSGEDCGDEEDEEDKPPPPPQIPASCTCKWCCKWTVCVNTGLVASVFSRV